MECGLYSEWGEPDFATPYGHAAGEDTAMEVSSMQQQQQPPPPPSLFSAVPPPSGAGGEGVTAMPVVYNTEHHHHVPPTPAGGPELVRILYVDPTVVNVWDCARQFEDAVQEFCLPQLIAAVDIVRDGMEALNQAVRVDYSVIIIAWDLRPPGKLEHPPITGRALAERLRELRVPSHLVVCAAGGVPSHEVAEQVGFEAVLKLPLDKKRFCAGIAALVLGPEGSQAIAAATAPPELPSMPPARFWSGDIGNDDPELESTTSFSGYRRAPPRLPISSSFSSPILLGGGGGGGRMPAAGAFLESWQPSEAIRHITKGPQSRRGVKRSRPPEGEGPPGFISAKVHAYAREDMQLNRG